MVVCKSPRPARLLEAGITGKLNIEPFNLTSVSDKLNRNDSVFSKN